MRLPNFCGGSYPSWSPNASAERSINVYPETIETPSGKSRVALYGTPGLQVFCTLPTQPVRGLFAGESRLFAVAGSHYYEVFTDGTFTDRGDVGDDASHTPVDLWPNGSQIMIVSAGKVWIDTGTAIVPAYYADGSGVIDALAPRSGVVNTVASSGDVVLTSGDNFTADMAGGRIVIDSIEYTVKQYFAVDHVTVVEPIPDATGVAYSTPSSVIWIGGDKFLESFAGGSIVITPTGSSATTYTVDEYIDAEHMTLVEAITDQTQSEYAIPTGPGGTLIQVLATRGTFLDTYFIVQVPNSKTFAFSRQWDGKYWNPLEQSVKEGYPDNIAAIYSDHEELYLFGTHWSIEVWRNQGVAEAAGGFVRDPGAFVHAGCVAPWSIASVAGGLHFLGGDTRGRLVAYRLQGFQPVRISTHALEQLWSNYTTVWDAYGYAYSENGHEFWVLSFQSSDATFVYDATDQQWHDRATWDGTNWHKIKARCHTFVFNKHFVGAWDTGIIYEQDQDIFSDAGTAIRRMRVSSHLSNEEVNIIHHRLQLDAEVSGTAPSWDLSWSDDDGATWVTPKTRAPSVSGNRGRYVWNRLGKARDRIYRVTTMDAAKIAVVDAYLNPQPTVGIS